MERCPVCRARLKSNDTCHRCETELSLLQALDETVQRLEQQAVQDLVVADYRAAMGKLKRAIELKPSTFARHLLGFVQQKERGQVS